MDEGDGRVEKKVNKQRYVYSRRFPDVEAT